MFLILSSLSSTKLCSHLKSLLEILWKLLLPYSSLVLFAEAGHVVLAVVLHLQGVTAGIYFYCTI